LIEILGAQPFGREGAVYPL